MTDDATGDETSAAADDGTSAATDDGTDQSATATGRLEAFGAGPLLGDRWERFLSWLFGDRAGLAVFLAAVVVLGALWRVDLLMNDSTTVANLLVNVADGRLSVTDAPYSLTAGEQPGLVRVDGRLYGRNYGEVYLAVGILWLLDALAGLVDLRLLLAAAWSLAGIGLARTLAGLVDRPRVADAGALVALGVFGVSMLVATRIDWFDAPRPIVALGASTVLLAAVGAVVAYRLVTWAADRRTGVAAGLALVVATPIGFWASFPKRHVLSATALLLTCYLFAISRTGSGRHPTLARAGAYVPLCYLASVHAFEAAFALVVLGVLDVLTAPANDRRTLAVVATVAFVSLTPMLATNLAISGDPFQTPRMLPGAQGDLPLDPGAGPGTGGDSGPSGGGGGPFGGPDPGGTSGSGGAGGGDGPSRLPFVEVLGPLLPILEKSWWVGSYMVEALVAGLAATLEPDRLVSVFVRSGWIPGVDYQPDGFEAIELAALEAFPLAGALAWVPVAAATRLRGGIDRVSGRLRAGLADPRRQTDLLAGGLAATFLVVYLPYLPLQATITVRYVVPAVPLVLYAVARLGPVRAATRDATRALVGAYGVALLVGAVGYALVIGGLDPAQGEAVQLHALVGLAWAAILAGATATWPAHRDARVVGIALGVAAAATTLFLGLAALAYFADGHHALDLVRLVAEELGWRG